jgi:ribosomal protein S18 acetylase RimI-like enzyme
MSVTIVQLSLRDVLARAEELAGVYRDMYELPVESGVGFQQTLAEHARREGFRLCVVRDAERDALVGLAYGFTGQVGQPWRDALALAVDQATRDQWLTDYFELAEIGLVPAFRGRGIGGRLHDRLLADLPHPRSVLTVRAGNDAAKRLYRRRGWLTLNERFYSASGRGPYLVLGLTLAGRPGSAPD